MMVMLQKRGRALPMRQAVGHTPGGEVMLMWKKRLYIVLRFLVCLVILACIFTIKAR